MTERKLCDRCKERFARALAHAFREPISIIKLVESECGLPDRKWERISRDDHETIVCVALGKVLAITMIGAFVRSTGKFPSKDDLADWVKRYAAILQKELEYHLKSLETLGLPKAEEASP